MFISFYRCCNSSSALHRSETCIAFPHSTFHLVSLTGQILYQIRLFLGSLALIFGRDGHSSPSLFSVGIRGNDSRLPAVCQERNRKVTLRSWRSRLEMRGRNRSRSL